jgi:hypothetical protein
MTKPEEVSATPESLPTRPRLPSVGPPHPHRSGFGYFLRLLDATCYFLCVCSIIAGAVFLILNIWGLVSQKIVLQSVASLFFVTLACLLVLGLNRFERLRHDGKPLP